MYYSVYFSEIRGWCLINCSSEMLKLSPHFWNTKTNAVFCFYFQKIKDVSFKIIKIHTLFNVTVKNQTRPALIKNFLVIFLIAYASIPVEQDIYCNFGHRMPAEVNFQPILWVLAFFYYISKNLGSRYFFSSQIFCVLIWF